MKRKITLPGSLTAAGIGLMALALWLVSYGVRHDPVILKTPVRAEELAEAFLSAVCAGDYEKASERLYGTPDLGKPLKDGSMAVSLMWESFLDSFTYDPLGECYPAGSGVAIDATIRFLDIPDAMGRLETCARELLEKRTLAAETSQEIYDENNEYRQEVISQVLQDAVARTLEKNAQRRERTVSLRLVYEGEQWWILPEAELLRVLAGDFSG